MRSRRHLVLAVVLALLAAACGGGRRAVAPRPEAEQEQAANGGTVAIAAESEPNCVDWVGTCAGQAWGTRTMYATTMPFAFDIDGKGAFQPGALLAGAPTLEPGPPMRVTYRIRPDAIWSDGEPVTSHDFRYSWNEIARGPTVRERGGYDKIADVDDSNPGVAVVTFLEPYGAWRELFGVRPAILPSHLLEGKDRAALMKDGYQWSAGPWVIDHWTKGEEVKLARNPRYWGPKPHLDAVVFRFIPDATAQIQALRTGQVLAAFPSPTATTLEQLQAAPELDVKVQESLVISAIWFNAEKPLLASRTVRQALAYATDREALLAQGVGRVRPELKVLQALLPPSLGDFYTPVFSRYRHDLAKVTELMRADGWAKGSDGLWAKGGQRATLELSVSSTGAGTDLLLSQWKEAGFDASARQVAPSALSSDISHGAFEVVTFGLGPISDPGLCFLLCSANIPTAANAYSGLNRTRLSSPTLDQLWSAVDREVDDRKRADLVRRGLEETAVEVPALPTSPPLHVLVTSKRVGGRIETHLGLGPFVTMNEWFLRT